MIQRITLLVFAFLVCSCSKKNNIENQNFTLSAFTYTPYITTDVVFQNKNLGVGNGALNDNVTLKSGDYKIQWSDAESGTKFTSLNKVIIPDTLQTQFIIFHIYPTGYVETVFSDDYPKESAKGLQFMGEKK